jgi:transposase
MKMALKNLSANCFRKFKRLQLTFQVVYCIHKAKAVTQWLASHPRFELLWLPTYGPRANPIERVFGDVHDKCTRNHKRKRLRDLVQEVERQVQEKGPWQYKLSQLYDAPEVTAAVEHIAAVKQSKLVA